RARSVAPTLPHSGAAMGLASSEPRHFKELAEIARAFPSTAAIHRHDVLRWHAEHESRVRLTARHFGLSPDTVSRWARAYAELGTRGLEGQSRRPKRMRQPTTPTATVVRIRELRELYPRWGREKLRVLLLREGLDVSAKTIDRTINRLRARGDLKEPLSVRKALRARARAALRPRRPGDLVVDRPGFLQIDSQELRLGPHVIFTFAAVDFFTRKRVVAASNRLTSAAGARFLQRVQERDFWGFSVPGDRGYGPISPPQKRSQFI
ncbi:MAG: helix-turn-helix domain-containing protein, partial [Candidatus Rokuibacteriota bacterium]